MHRYIDVTY